MTVLILAEHRDGEPAAVVSHVIGAARRLDESVTLLFAGARSREAAERVAGLTGVGEVLWAGHPESGRMPSEDLAVLVQELAPGYSHILAAASTFGAELIPRLGALLGIQPVTGVVEIRDARTLVRPVHAGAVWAVMRVQGSPVLLTVHPWAFLPVDAGLQSAPVRSLGERPGLGLSRCLDWFSSQVSGRPDLATARIVVAGGGGLEERGDFSVVERLAQALGGAVGASRGAVDAGLAPADLQIGQTGRIVAPEFYIALGISGAIQHLAGIKEAGIIVSINRDPQAPMAAVADLALTADLYEAVPALLAALEVHPARPV